LHRLRVSQFSSRRYEPVLHPWTQTPQRLEHPVNTFNFDYLQTSAQLYLCSIVAIFELYPICKVELGMLTSNHRVTRGGQE